jgi:hypothetical protein
MPRNTDDSAYRKAQSRLTRQAAEKFTQPDWGRESSKARGEYDRLLEKAGTPVRKGGRK